MTAGIIIAAVAGVVTFAVIICFLARCRHCGGWHTDVAEEWMCERQHEKDVEDFAEEETAAGRLRKS